MFGSFYFISPIDFAQFRIWVTRNGKYAKAYKKKIEDLDYYRLSEEQLVNYHAIPLKYKKLKSITNVKLEDGEVCYYHLHRHFTESRMSPTDLDNESHLSTVSLNE